MAARQDRGADAACFPEIVTGALPVIYPFIVSNPGEAAQAKRRIAAVTIGHLPPPLARAVLPTKRASLNGWSTNMPRPTGSTADGASDWRGSSSRPRSAAASRVKPASIAGPGPTRRLRQIDAWLCDLKDLAIKDGVHVYGRRRFNK